jgi:hypothetical protein
MCDEGVSERERKERDKYLDEQRIDIDREVLLCGCVRPCGSVGDAHTPVTYEDNADV